MFIQPWDAALDSAEWQEWLARHDRFGILAVNNLDPAAGAAGACPPTSPSPATSCSAPGPTQPGLAAPGGSGRGRLAVIGDYAYIPTYWRAKAGGPDEDGVPTSYYATVQFVCRPTIVDDPQGKADILTAQLADFQPEGRHADRRPRRSTLRTDAARHPRRPADGLRVDAKFKYDDANPIDHRERVIERPRASATTGSTPAPPPSNAAASPRSATGRPTGTVGDDRTPENHGPVD